LQPSKFLKLFSPLVQKVALLVVGYLIIAIHANLDGICLEEAIVTHVAFLALPAQILLLATLARQVISSSIAYALRLVHFLVSRAYFIQLHAHHV